MVAVRLRGRPWSAVVSDMVEGVIVANRLGGADADGARRALWSALESDGLLPTEDRTDDETTRGRRRHLSIARGTEAA